MEEASYYPELTVVENLDIARRMQRISDQGAVDRAIRKLDLDAHRNKKAKNLSLGNRQRLGLAKAMIHNPEILILDEPINGLDPASVVEIREMLLDLSRNSGVTIFISSHLLEELSKLIDCVAIMEMADDRLELMEDRALDNPEILAELLVRASEPPTHLNVVTENLESYFLRTIREAGRIHE